MASYIYLQDGASKLLLESGDAYLLEQSLPESISIADAGAGADAQTIQGTPALADSGSGAEAQTIQATLPIAQTGSGVDAVGIAAIIFM
jgi:L-cysteine desulfidase